MSKHFGIITSNVLAEEVVPKDVHKSNTQRTLFIGTIVRVERMLTDSTSYVRCLKDDKENWEPIQFNCPKDTWILVPEKLWQYLAAVVSPQERVRVATNQERYERLLLIAKEMVVGYTDDKNVHLGTIKFIGRVQSIGMCFGIKLHDKKQNSRCDGSIGNVQYFSCLPGFGLFATIDKLVAHNVLYPSKSSDEKINKYSAVAPDRHSLATIKHTTASSKTNSCVVQKLQTSNADSRLSPAINPLHLDEMAENAMALKSSQTLLKEFKKESVNRNHDFDQNSILPSDKLLLLTNNNATKYSAGLINGDKILNASDSKVSEAFLNISELNKAVLQPDTGRIRNKSANPLAHIISSSSMPNSKKRKEPTFKSYDPELSQQRACAAGVDASTEPKDGSNDTGMYIEPDSALTNDISVGTMVQVGEEGALVSGNMLCGVVRWLGLELPNNNSGVPKRPETTSANLIIVGVEVDDDDDAPPDLDYNFTDGTFAGKRRFVCSSRDTQHAIFVPLAMCRKDRRFAEESNGEAGTSAMARTMTRVTGNAAQSALGGRAGETAPIREVDRNWDRRFEEEKQKLIDADNGNPVIKGVIAPVILKTEEDVKAVCTTFRGIQGHHNSCYLDATLFSMFTFTPVFDSLIYRKKTTNDIPDYEEVQRVLREEIVNPLRINLFVNADRVMKLRRLLDKLSSVSGLTSEEKDPEEFLNSLLAQILRAEPFLKLNSGQESYFYQLFIEKDDRLKLPTVQQLFEQSFHTSEIKLKEVPSCLIIQMPRFGKNYKMYPRIIPSQLLDITDIIENSPRGCTICGNLAYYECTSCYAANNSSTASIHDGGLENTAFCKRCVQTFHQHSNRVDHEPRPLDLPPDYQALVEAGHESPQPPRLYMNLFAVVCIETSHYVAFVKCGSDIDAPWCFFDSMADRKGETNGFNIPAMVACPDVLKWLSDDKICHTLHADNPLDRHLPEHARRLLCDAYICMYQKTDIMMYK